VETVWSGLSLLLMLAVAGVLIFLSRRDTGARHGYRPGHRHSGHGSPRILTRSGSYTTLGYALTFTLFGALFLVSGVIGYRLGRGDVAMAGTRWSDGCIWQQIWMGLVMACLAAWFWHKGLREIRSNVHVPELAGRDPAAPPSRRIERR
jgi:hypothetical protein